LAHEAAALKPALWTQIANGRTEFGRAELGWCYTERIVIVITSERDCRVLISSENTVSIFLVFNCVTHPVYGGIQSILFNICGI